MPSKLLLFLCALPLAAQTPGAIQDTLKSARAAERAGNIEQARTGFESAFNLADAANQSALAAGIAVELSELLESSGRASDAAAFLTQAATRLQSSGAAAVPIGNGLTHVAAALNREMRAGDARSALQTSLDIFRQAYGPDAPCVATVLESLASTDRILNQNALAAQETSEAVRILRTNQTQTFAQVRRVGGDVAPPRVTYKVDPQYDEQARAAHLAGTVLLSVVVTPDGVAQDIQVNMPLGLGLDEQAISAVRQWRFSPGKADGQAVPVRANIEVNFRLL